MYGFKHEKIDKSVKFANGKVYVNGIEGFGVMQRRGC
jgi:transposase